MFLVLPDGKTIIGEDFDNKNMLISEDITSNENDAFNEIYQCEDTIFTVFFHAVSECLLAGGRDGKLRQYKKGKDTKGWTLVKDYGDIGIGWINSAEEIGNLIIFGGTFELKVIDCVNQEPLKGTFDTAITNVCSLQICELSKQQMYLSVNGNGPCYSNDRSDLFEVTDLAKQFGYNFENLKVHTKETKINMIEEKKQTQNFEVIKEIKGNKKVIESPSTKQNDFTHCECGSQCMMESYFSNNPQCFNVFSEKLISKFNKHLISSKGKKA
jgi:hypothetical protein